MAVTLFGDVRHTGNQTYNLAEGAGKSGVSNPPPSLSNHLEDLLFG